MNLISSGREITIERFAPRSLPILTRWQEALATAHQGHGRLARRRPEGLMECCLGVLCRVEGLPSEVDASGLYTYYKSAVYYSGLSALDAYGSIPAVTFDEDDREVRCLSLASLNDYGFTEISEILGMLFTP